MSPRYRSRRPDAPRPDRTSSRRRTARLALALAAAVVLVECRDAPPVPTEVAPPKALPRPAGPPRAPAVTAGGSTVVLVGAGDVSRCDTQNDEATAKLLDTIPGTVFLAGDGTYVNGTASEYACYDSTWGRHKARTRPAPGDRDYNTAGATGYYGYFGAAAGDPNRGYYSYDIGEWHVVVLNSELATSVGSAQEQWLKGDLAATTKSCKLAVWHHPLFSSVTPTRTAVKPLWDDLYAAKTAVVVNAHTRVYERFAPQTPAGVADSANGIRQFVVGTGGTGFSAFLATPAANSVVRDNKTFGVLKLTLGAGTYSWNFVPVAGKTFADSGSGTCPGYVPPGGGEGTPAVNAGADQRVSLGGTVSVSASFTDAATDAPWAYSVRWGDGSAETTGSTSSSPIAASHQFAAVGTDTVVVTVTDAGGLAGVDTMLVTVADTVNQAPVAKAGGPYVGTVGAAISFDGSGSSDPDGNTPLAHAWAFGDGATGTGATPTHAYATAGSYTVSLTVTDAKGAASAAATTTVTVNAAPSTPPVVNAGPDQSLVAGSALSFSGSFTDAGANDGPWAWSIDWGDGSAPATGSAAAQGTAITAQHGYATAGSYSLTFRVTDRNGDAGADVAAVTVTQPGSNGVVFVGAGDIAGCGRPGAGQTAALIDAMPGSTAWAAGDNAYVDGTDAEFANCYDPTWGRFKSRTIPASGNHEYNTAGASGYFNYFGALAGERGKGYYSKDVGAWHVIVLNSNNTDVSTADSSPQVQWLKADLARATNKCVLAIWHHPRFYSTKGGSGSRGYVKPFWDALYAANAELVLVGHQHDYERFAPQTPAGVADPVRGIRQFIVGTGGYGFGGFDPPYAANSEVRQNGTFGVLKLTLYDGSYTWEFVPIAGQTFTDKGSGTCH